MKLKFYKKFDPADIMNVVLKEEDIMKRYNVTMLAQRKFFKSPYLLAKVSPPKKV